MTDLNCHRAGTLAEFDPSSHGAQRDIAAGFERTGGIVLEMAAQLHAHGQATEDTINASTVLGRHLGVEGSIVAGWDGVVFMPSAPGSALVFSLRSVTPVDVRVDRTIRLIQTCDAALKDELSADAIEERFERISLMPAPSSLVFCFAAVGGACAMGIIFGELRPSGLSLIAISAGIGALARRLLIAHRAGLFLQNLVAALISGLIAALGARAGFAGNLQLDAACPCMILIPGPHLLNGALDLLFNRIPLALARLTFASLAIGAISAGLLLGLAAGARVLPVAPTHSTISLWLEVAAGGVAAACFATFYAMPRGLLVWPAVIGMLAHAVHWTARAAAGLSPPISATLASLVAGVALVPVAKRLHLPFAGIGFAAVVSMLPGISIFPMSSALMSLAAHGSASNPALVADTLSYGMTAALTVAGLALGLLSPKSLVDAFRRQTEASTSETAARDEGLHRPRSEG